MTLLITGLVMWCAVHLFPALAVQTRADIIARSGRAFYRTGFALLIICSIVLMVFGWRSTVPAPLYQPPDWGRGAAYVLTLVTFILFVAAKRRTNIKRILRHPQLIGVTLWSFGHLLANGDSRSLILFAGIGIWAVLEMVLINRRAGAWFRPETGPVINDVLVAVLGVILYSVLLWVHPYLSGVQLL